MSDLTRERLRNVGLVLGLAAVIGAWALLFIWPWMIVVWLVALFGLMIVAAIFVWPFEDSP